MVAGQRMIDAAAARPKALLVRAGATLIAVAVLSKLTTLAADSYVAARFGLTVDADSYLVAIGLLGALLSAPGETLRLAIVPVFGGHLRQGDRRSAAGVLVLVLAATLVAGSIAALIMALAAPWLARVVAPGIGPEGEATLVLLIRVVAPAIVAGLVMTLLLGALHTELRFGGPGLASMALGGGVVGMGLLLGGRLGVTSLAIGYVAGTVAVVAVLAWLSRGVFQDGVSMAHARADVRPFLRLAVPTGLAISIVSLGAVIERAVASLTGVGNVASLGFAIKLITQASLLSQSIWTPLTPLLTAAGATVAVEGDGRLVSFSLRLVVLVLTPMTALLIALREPVVGVIFERGAFTASDTAMTARLLALHSGSLLGEGLFMVAVAALLAFHDSGTRLLASGVLIAGKVALIALFAPLLGVAGIAIAASLSSLAAGAFAVHVLSRRFRAGELREFVVLGAKALAGGLAVVAVAVVLAAMVAGATGDGGSLSTRVLQLGIAGAGGALVYVGALALFGVEESRLGLAKARAYFGGVRR